MTSQRGDVLDVYSLVNKTFAEGMSETVSRHFFVVQDLVSFKLLMDSLTAHGLTVTGYKQAVCFWIPPVLHPFLIGFDEIVVHWDHSPFTALSGGYSYAPVTFIHGRHIEVPHFADSETSLQHEHEQWRDFLPVFFSSACKARI
jgi:hypothetical protein